MSVCEQVDLRISSLEEMVFFRKLRQEKHNSTFVKLLNEALVSNEVTLWCVFLNLTRAGIRFALVFHQNCGRCFLLVYHDDDEEDDVDDYDFVD